MPDQPAPAPRPSGVATAVTTNHRTCRGVVIAALVVTILLWGSAFVGIEATVDRLGAFGLAFARYAVAAVLVVVIGLLLQGRQVLVFDSLRHFGAVAVCAALVVVVYNVGLNYGEQFVSGATASFLMGQQPIITILLGAVLLRERLSTRQLLGIGVGVVGTVLLLQAEGGIAGAAIGILSVLVAAVAECGYFLLAKRMLGHQSPLRFHVQVTVLGAVMLAPMAISEGQLGNLDGHHLAWVLYLGVGPTAAAYFLWNYALSQATTAQVAASLYGLPLATILVGLLVLGTIPSMLGLAGGIVALLGAFLCAGLRTE